MGKKNVKASIILIVFIVLLATVPAGGYYILNQSYSELKHEKQNLENELEITLDQLNDSNVELSQLETEIEQYESSLQENISRLQPLKSGDECHLHDPVWSEVLEFLESNEDTDIKKMIDNAKKQGIRCAYVNAVYELLGFNTLDYGMVYLEPATYYLVYPEIGANYFNCVYEQPYESSLSEDEYTITEILVMW
jgi:hypothetical protein